MMYANEEYIELLTSGLSQKTGVKIVASDNWGADIEKQTLHYDKDSLRMLPFEVVRGLLLHEIAHIMDTKSKKTRLLQKHGQSMLNVYNVFEDMRIEGFLTDRFGSFASSALEFVNYSNVYERMQAPKVEGTKLHQFLILALARHYSIYYSPIANLIGYDAERVFRDDLNTFKFDEDVVRKHLEHRYELEDLMHRVHKRNSTYSMQTLVDKEVYPLIKEWMDEPQKDMKEVGMNTKPQPGQGFKSKQPDVKPINKPTEKEAGALLQPYAATLAQRLTSILKEKAMTRWYGAYKRGKLLDKNTYKVCIPGEDRMFSKKNVPDIPHYSVYMALDNSGSMGGTSAVYAFMGAVLLKKTCDALKFKSRFYKYDTGAYEMENLDLYQGTGGGTYDTVALEKISEDIDPSDDNIIFIITDGETDRNSDFDVVYRELVKKKNSIVYGIGIGDVERMQDSLKENYEHYTVVPKVEELPQALIGVMRNIVHR